MVLDQQELQDDLRALADLLHQQGTLLLATTTSYSFLKPLRQHAKEQLGIEHFSFMKKQCAGRAEECTEIREQLHRLGEAVRAAHARAVRKAEPSRGLKKVLLMPLKALCMPTQRAPAFVALPHGIQDSDLVSCNACTAGESGKGNRKLRDSQSNTLLQEELRKATNPQIALEVNATGLSDAHVAAAADGEKAEVVAAEKSSTPAAKDEKQESLQASGLRAKAEVQGASGEPKAGRSLTLPVASLQSTGELSYDSPPGNQVTRGSVILDEPLAAAALQASDCSTFASHLPVHDKLGAACNQAALGPRGTASSTDLQARPRRRLPHNQQLLSAPKDEGRPQVHFRGVTRCQCRTQCERPPCLT